MKLRLQITKERSIRFVSHLDFLRAIERSIRRAQLPVAYSEGFNPHMKFSLASALGVGVVSYAEYVEIEMAEPVEVEVAMASLRQNLPRGIRLLAGEAVATNEPALMSRADQFEYRVTLPGVDAALADKVEQFNKAANLLYRKPAPKRKEGYKEVDVKHYIDSVEYKVEQDKTVFHFWIKNFDEGSLKAFDVIQVLNLPTANADVERLSIKFR